MYLIIIKIWDFLLFHPFEEGRTKAFQGPKADKAVRLHYRNSVITSWFNVGKTSCAKVVLHVGCGEGAAFRKCRTWRKEMENWHSEQAAKCLNLCQA